MHAMCFRLIRGGGIPSDDNVHTMCFRMISSVFLLMMMMMVVGIPCVLG